MRRISFIVALLLMLTLVGTVGFHLLTGDPWLHCAYQAIITLTTVGSQQPDPLSDGSILFIIFYLVFGLGVFTYSAFQLGQAIFSFEMRFLLERRRMQNAISKLKDHFIVCGQGRMGATICHYLHVRKRPFVAIDIVEEHLIQSAQEHGWLYLHGDATDDQAGNVDERADRTSHDNRDEDEGKGAHESDNCRNIHPGLLS